ncbi:unnamed protein product, partial [marine sediment metagenome]
PDGTYITYEYDTLNRLTYIRDADGGPVVQYNYDALSRRISAQYANGTTATYSYDIADRLLSLNNQTNTGSHNYAYSYDGVGNRLTMTVNGSNVHRYSYDGIYQLTDVDYPDGFFVGDTTFNYDPVGSRESVINSGTTNYVSNNLNQYTSVGGTAHSYDKNGNLTDDGTHKYYYNCENRLTDVNDANDQLIASYSYDAFGRRISRFTNHDSRTTIFIYDGDQVICEYDHYNRLRHKFLYGTGIDEAVRMTNVWPSADIAGGGDVDFG